MLKNLPTTVYIAAALMLGAFFSGAVRGGNPASVVNQAADLIEEQMGDPGMPREALALDNETEKNIQEFLSRPSRGPKIARPRLALAALDVAKSHIGNSRENPATRVKQYLALFGLPFQYPDGTYVPFCAAGVGFVSAQAYRHITRQPSNLDDSNTPLIFRDSLTDVKRDWTKAHPSCREMMKASQDAGTWLSSGPFLSLDAGHGGPNTEAGAKAGSEEKISPRWH